MLHRLAVRRPQLASLGSLFGGGGLGGLEGMQGALSGVEQVVGLAVARRRLRRQVARQAASRASSELRMQLDGLTVAVRHRQRDELRILENRSPPAEFEARRASNQLPGPRSPPAAGRTFKMQP